MKKFLATIEVGKGQKRRFTKATHAKAYYLKDYAQAFQWNYGYINNTLSADGDELDVFIFGRKYKPFNVVKIKPRYVVFTEENGVSDDKILAGRVRNKDLSRILEVLITDSNRIVRRVGGKTAALNLIQNEMGGLNGNNARNN